MAVSRRARHAAIGWSCGRFVGWPFFPVRGCVHAWFDRVRSRAEVYLLLRRAFVKPSMSWPPEMCPKST